MAEFIPNYMLWEMLPVSTHQPILLITTPPSAHGNLLSQNMACGHSLFYWLSELDYLQASVFLEAIRYGASFKPPNLVVLGTVGTLRSLKKRSLR